MMRCFARPCSLLTLLTTTLLKRFFGRLRPSDRIRVLRTFNLRSLEHNFSLPSGDSAQAALWACLAAWTYHSPLPLLIVPATMVGRVYFGAHYLGDTIVGAAIGALWAHVVHWTMPIVLGCNGSGGVSSMFAAAAATPLVAAWSALACASV